MSQTFRAGAIAAAALFAAAVSGVVTGGVRAEAGEPASTVEAAPAAAADAAMPRFYAEEVVQPLPEESEDEQAAGSLRELVATMPVDGELSRDLRCLAQAIYFEARGEPLNGQLAVGQVIVNRAASGLFPSDYCSVVTQRGQFSFVKGGRIPAVKQGSAAWQRARALARIAHQDLWESEAGDALYFHATYVRPRWASRKTARATIDSHIFYR